MIFLGSGYQVFGLWQYFDDWLFEFQKLEYWVELVKFFEKYKFYGVFIVDVLGKIVVFLIVIKVF